MGRSVALATVCAAAFAVGCTVNSSEEEAIHDLAQARRHMVQEQIRGRGVRFAPGGIRRGAAGHDVCFIHPKGNDASPIGGEGVLIELVQAPPEVLAAYRETESRASGA